MSLISELRRRNVFRVAAAYLVVGWLLTEVLTTILPELGAPAWTAKAVILIFAFGFIPTIVFAWIYELTPDGVKRQHEIDLDESITPRTARKLDYVTGTAVVIGVIFVGLFSARSTVDEETLPAVEISSASVAVLPFVNMSNDKDNEYFSDGLTETLLHMLAQVPDLKVAARTSSFSFKGQNKTIGEIAAALEVAHVLEGSVQRVGDRVRITAQLIRASDGFHLWSENYDRTLDDIFGIQDEIAVKVGGALSASLLGAGSAIAGVSTLSTDAYDLYLQALNERKTYSYGGLQAAEDLLKGALTIDPDFLDAKIELAGIYLQQVETGLIEQDAAHPEIIAITSQVLATRPDDADARAIKLFAETGTSTSLHGAAPSSVFEVIGELEQIVESAPKALQPKILLMRYYGLTQQNEKALPLMMQALASDPFNARIHYELGNLYSGMGRWDDARDSLEKSLAIEPSQPNAYANLARISLQSGDGTDYIHQFLKAVESDPVDHELPGIIAQFLYELELVEEGDDFRKRVLAIAPTSEIAYRIELLRAISLGDEAGSVASARQAVEDNVEDRRFAYGGAVQHLLRTAAKNDTIADEFAYLEEQAPGILDIDADSIPFKYRAAQLTAFDAWYKTESLEQINQRIDTLMTFARSFGFDPEKDPKTRLGILALRGETDAAIEIALTSLFTEPVAINLGWERTLSQAQYADIVADPRVQTALRRWEEQEAALRAQVRAFLADLQAST